MSAFIKRQPARVVDLGTRPGLNGQVLISTGVAGLDKLLGGGLPLGSLLLIVEDSHSQQHLNLLKCFLAEGFSCKHSLALITGQQLSMQEAAQLMPDEAKSSSSSSSGGAGTQAHTHTATGSSTAPPSSTTVAPDDGLKIAWQYRKYIQNQQRADSGIQQPQRTTTSSSRSPATSTSSSAAAAKALAAGVGREWCHQFDLTRSVTADALQAAKLQLSCCCTEQQKGASAVRAAAAAAATFLSPFQPKGPIPVPSRDPASIGRLVLQSLGSPDWWPQSSSSASLEALEGAMLAAVAALRLAVQDATCAAVITCPAGMYSESFQTQLQHLCDIVLCVQSLADNSDVYRLLPDPTSAAALLEVRRVPELGLLRQRYSEERLYVIRMKRRSISVGVLDLVPLEAASEQPGRADGSGKSDKPAAAQICGTGPGTSKLDF